MLILKFEIEEDDDSIEEDKNLCSKLMRIRPVHDIVMMILLLIMITLPLIVEHLKNFKSIFDIVTLFRFSYTT